MFGMSPYARAFLLDDYALGDTKPKKVRFVMDPLIGSALISGGSSLLGGFLSSGSSRSAAREANKLTRELYYADREYNTPANQVARLREAGLNPNLVYGSSGSVSGNTSKGAPRMDSIGGYDFDFAGALNAMATEASIRKTDKESEAVDAQIEQTKEATREVKQRAESLALDNARKRHDNAIIDGTPLRSSDTGIVPIAVRAGVQGYRKFVAPVVEAYHRSGVADNVRTASGMIMRDLKRGIDNYVINPYNNFTRRASNYFYKEIDFHRRGWNNFKKELNSFRKR